MATLRSTVVKTLQIFAGALIGFFVVLGSFLIYIRLYLAYHPQPQGIGQVYGVLFPSVLGAIVGSFVAAVLVLRRSAP